MRLLDAASFWVRTHAFASHVLSGVFAAYRLLRNPLGSEKSVGKYRSLGKDMPGHRDQ